jgi:hypothetical protein
VFEFESAGDYIEIMKCAGKIAVCLAGSLAFSASLRADDVLLPGNPYAPVVVRNVFGLNPPPLVDPNAPSADPPVKITPNGIMSIFGQLQVLFKVAGKTPGQDAYTLSEGEQQDDIEVTKIDEKAGIVTFNNHGVVQSLPLVPATPTSTPAIPSSFGNPGAPGNVPGSSGPGGNNGFNNRFGNRNGNGGRNRGDGGNGGGNPGADDGTGLRNIPTRYGSQQAAIDPVVQTVLVEANRLKAQQEGNPNASIFPKTEMSPELNSDNGNSPQ